MADETDCLLGYTIHHVHFGKSYASFPQSFVIVKLTARQFSERYVDATKLTKDQFTLLIRGLTN